ncbi:terpenoid cyclases/protein prenyltransferase alpha-alpha toroid [Bombardia bombarda]|uniref:Terpenoid cyclases/protein prenyltransferase alpha-alpha toroid n=1 Tax=Bombardia bombarda TaxID=252184 RepID=A0AA39X1B6_9PEZI|nr:terpenoid cyclases/protein prenyltransferase alpha-alpha toroid [Bombardia bombarda]
MADSAAPGESEPSLNVEQHLKYWKRCLRSPLPHVYLGNEGNRMALAYFIINSISILSPPRTEPATGDQPKSPPLITSEERRRMREWVLAHQHPGGGFSGTSSLVFPLHDYEEWDFDADAPTQEGSGLANIAATLFALQLLALLVDDEEDEETAEGAFRGVDRVQTLRWLKKLQRPDGSFGEVLMKMPGHGWFIGGGYDMRYCYIAAAVRWMLRGDVQQGQPGWVEDFDTVGFTKYILRSQTYDGGFAGSSQDEPHAGYAYCAISALSLLDRPLEGSPALHPSKILRVGIRSMPALTHWLASRQFVYLEPPATQNEEEEDDPVNFLLPSSLDDLALDDKLQHFAFNGRCNKVADTCYCWWVCAALANLGCMDAMVQRGPSRRFLLDKMQHMIGGFGKYPGSPPDLYHGCFGLMILGVMGESGIREVDSALAVPVETVKRMEKARRGLLRRAGEEGKPGAFGREMVELGLELCGERPGWLVAVGR